MVMGWDEEYLASYPDVLAALSGLEDIGLPEGVGLPGIPAIEVYDDVVLYTFPGDEDDGLVRPVRRAWRRAGRADFARTVTAEWEAHVERVRAGLPAAERVLRVAKTAGLTGEPAELALWVNQSVTLWPGRGVCVLEGLYDLEVLSGSSGWSTKVWISTSMGSEEVVEVTIDRINPGCPWLAEEAPAGQVLGAGLGWLAEEATAWLIDKVDASVDGGIFHYLSEENPASTPGAPAVRPEVEVLAGERSVIPTGTAVQDMTGGDRP
ncbi:hypothetical protein [uncultured Actinomyces sp.]|uniref:hypothetical protein n=1 Tax=uncultured Actinomyces sp. TaxID=249061 RepID=UPI0028D3738D|nr:hypothetical protein [uncultured Actinomyces sp.]